MARPAGAPARQAALRSQRAAAAAAREGRASPASRALHARPPARPAVRAPYPTHRMLPTHTHTALHGISASEVQARLTTALRRIGVAAVLDIGVAREMALAEAAEEFMQRCAWLQAYAPPRVGAAACGSVCAHMCVRGCVCSSSGGGG